jgi:hypothetical protein
MLLDKLVELAVRMRGVFKPLAAEPSVRLTDEVLEIQRGLFLIAEF